MKEVVPLAKARDEAIFGAKAVGLGDAIRQGLPVPPGFALSGAIVEAVAARQERVTGKVAKSIGSLEVPLAVRSSCVDEDGASASFAGQHLTLLNVATLDDVTPALREIWWSANSDSAITYRQRVGLFSRPNVGVVVQTLLDPDVAGVLFTRNPVNGADERVIEASWGLGEAVVAGRVIPDNYRVDRSGSVLERTPGVKKIAIRSAPEGGTIDQEVSSELVERSCLDDDMLRRLNELAGRCEQIYGNDRDVEWAFADGKLFLLQCRAMTRSVRSISATPPPVAPPAETLARVGLFADLHRREVEQISRMFKERRFAAGETIAKEGAGGASFFVIESGEASVSIGGRVRATLGPGDHFGEIALIDEGARSATITAASDLVCYGLTLWDFRPLVQRNAMIGWKLLQTLAKRLRAAQSD
ncbi:MAG: PEP/pyruvate-binding domain-containing protein [Actinomycetota bacterium]|nr:cyclic nucleotide-binding domain-containing protein [Actinomycetota bacterium]